MNGKEHDESLAGPGEPELSSDPDLSSDPGLGRPPVPVDFAARVLERVGIGRERYDTYVRLESAAGGLFVAFSPTSVTGSVPAIEGLTAERFEELHRSRTGRSAITTSRRFPGLVTAVRTGRARKLPLDCGPDGLPETDVLQAIRVIPAGQLRPLSWIAREASLPPATDLAMVLGVLARNPLVVLVPCHRVTYENGVPCDAAYPSSIGDALRTAEGIDMIEVRRWAHGDGAFLGSDTTRIYCHPTCSHARRITPPHRVVFTNARAAHRAGYRACKSCRPLPT